MYQVHGRASLSAVSASVTIQHTTNDCTKNSKTQYEHAIFLNLQEKILHENGNLTKNWNTLLKKFKKSKQNLH